MDKHNSISTYIRVQITTADPTQLLRRLNNAEVAVFDAAYISDIAFEITVSNRHFKTMKTLLRTDDHIKIKRVWGISRIFTKITLRSVLLLCFIVILSLTLYVPGRIFFLKVEGNTTLPSKLILEKAADCGICFGASRRTVRSEKMKNSLLAEIPELEWAGINTTGCVATILVKERESQKEIQPAAKSVSSIIAKRDGVILSCSVAKGNLLCKPGQAVKAGQMLVSGYTDCGNKILAAQSDGEILAQTYRTIRTVSPVSSVVRGKCTDQKTKYSLLIGKKLINFYKDSGISDTTCAKIYEQNYIALPGGLVLPVALITETWFYYESETANCNAEDFSWANRAADAYLSEQMVSGKILSKQTQLRLEKDICLFEGRYICIEMIGQVKKEETIYSNGEYYGENR